MLSEPTLQNDENSGKVAQGTASVGPLEAYSVSEFCRRNNIGVTTYYSLPEDDRPATMRIGRRVLISKESAAAWRRRMTEKTAAGQTSPEHQGTV